MLDAPQDSRPTIHELKTWLGPFDAIMKGEKTFEVRKDDRGFKVGDLLHLRRYDPQFKLYTGEDLTVRVSYILSGSEWGLQDGFVVMSIDTTFAHC